MGTSLIKKVAPQQIQNQSTFLIMDPLNRSDISRANFHFINHLTITGYHSEQIIWLAENIQNPKQKFLIKQIDKLILYDNNRIVPCLKELQLWLNAYEQNNIVSLFLANLLFAFQDYQYLYMVFQKIQGFTLDTVLKNHIFSQQQTKYVIAVIIQIIQYFHQNEYALTELAPEHFIVEKQTGKIKLLQIFNPILIDEVYTYNNITNPSIYAAPEILAKNKVLAESDFYTLGTMMYEMMTQKNVVMEELSYLEKIERHHIIEQKIQLKKYNLPEGWNPQAADFLVKLLIKNPLYRLGRYGLFQIKFHPWLQNYNWQILPTRSGITLTEPFFKKFQLKNHSSIIKHPFTKEDSESQLKNKIFLKLFEKYGYRRQIAQNTIGVEGKNKNYQNLNLKQSQKYYDDNSEEQNSSQSLQNEEEQQQNRKIEIDLRRKINQSIEKTKQKKGENT